MGCWPLAWMSLHPHIIMLYFKMLTRLPFPAPSSGHYGGLRFGFFLPVGTRDGYWDYMPSWQGNWDYMPPFGK